MKLEIEGAEVSTDSAWVHHQNDPYPGGLRYWLSVPRDMAAQWIGRLPDRGGEDIGEDWARRTLMWVAWMFSCVRDEAIRDGRIREVRFTHVLNTIDTVTVEVDGTHFTIAGICSPFISG